MGRVHERARPLGEADSTAAAGTTAALTPTPAVWAAAGLFGWSLLAIWDGTEAAPPPSVLGVLVLAIALAAAANRRMRTTGRLLLVLLAVVFASAALGPALGWVTIPGLALSVAVGVLAIVELVRG